MFRQARGAHVRRVCSPKKARLLRLYVTKARVRRGRLEIRRNVRAKFCGAFAGSLFGESPPIFTLPTKAIVAIFKAGFTSKEVAWTFKRTIDGLRRATLNGDLINVMTKMRRMRGLLWHRPLKLFQAPSIFLPGMSSYTFCPDADSFPVDPV